MATLRDFLPKQTFSVVSAYSGDGIIAQVAACDIHEDSSLSLRFPKWHSFAVGNRVTVHLDNRTGVETLDIHMRVYRASYRGMVTAVSGYSIEVALVYCQLFYQIRMTVFS